MRNARKEPLECVLGGIGSGALENIHDCYLALPWPAKDFSLAYICLTSDLCPDSSALIRRGITNNGDDLILGELTGGLV